MTAKRLFDVVMGSLGLLLVSPVLAGCALGIRIDSRGPVLFRQLRVGRYGAPFTILKFRTMRPARRSGELLVTADNDPRITRFGAWLRRTKLDELPQLWNVVRGDMSLVGPRPEVPRYVSLYPAEVRHVVLSVRPGITDPASLRFRHESELLARSPDPERDYIEKILPQKLAAYLDYVRDRSFAGDLHLIFATLRAVFGPPDEDDSPVTRGSA